MMDADAPPVPRSADASAADQSALEDWLTDLYGEPTSIIELRRPEGAGHSNETWLVTTAGSSDDRELVVRPQPTGPGVFPEYALDTQVRCMQALGATSIPGPVIVGFETTDEPLGRPFYVMDHVDGVIPPDYPPYTIGGWFLEAEAADQARLYDSSIATMAALHALDPFSSGFGFLVPPDLAGASETDCLAHQLTYWDDYLSRWIDDGRAHPTLDAALQWLHRNLPVYDRPARLNWGDARISNMIFRDFAPVAVIDWEMASIGAPEVDVAWYTWLEAFFAEGIGFPYLPGYPGEAGIVARYEEASGTTLRDFEWFKAFAGLRYGAILARIGIMRVGTGELPPDTDAARNNPCVRALAQLLDLPSPGNPGGPFG